MSEPVVIVGSGLAGYSVAKQFRLIDKTTPLTLLTSGIFLLANVLPINHNIKFSLINRLLTKITFLCKRKKTM